MSRNRLFNLCIAIALIIVVLFTVREATATSIVTSQNEAGINCSSLSSRHSIRTEYVEEMGAWMTYTEDGPTGVDGGLINLLSS